MVVCTCNLSAGEAKTGSSLGLDGLSSLLSEFQAHEWLCLLIDRWLLKDDPSICFLTSMCMCTHVPPSPQTIWDSLFENFIPLPVLSLGYFHSTLKLLNGTQHISLYMCLLRSREDGFIFLQSLTQILLRSRFSIDVLKNLFVFF